MPKDSMSERTARLEEESNGAKASFKEFRTEMRVRLDKQDEMLEKLMDDLKLRRWLAKILKTVILLLVALFGAFHAPHWLYQFFGLPEPPK